MEKEKCLIPSVISLHVRAIDQNDKDSLKTLLNLPESTNNRKYSYNLVRIYNTGYSNNRSKAVNENLPPYISNSNPKTQVLSTSLINSQFNALLKKANSEFSPLYPTCRLSNSNHYWSNTFKSNQTSVSSIFRSIISPTSDIEDSKNSNLSYNKSALNSNRSPIDSASQKLSNSTKKKSSISPKSEMIQETSQIPNPSPINKTSKSIENINKVPPISVICPSSISQLEISTCKSQIKKGHISSEKMIPKRSTSSFLIPIKERPTTSNSEAVTSSPTRSQTVITKFSNHHPKSVPFISPVNSGESKKNNQTNNNEIIGKNSQPCLFSKINNVQSIFIPNNQPFLYPDPCDNENSVSFMTRLSELTAYVNETVRWEKSRNSRRRCRPQTEIL